MKKTLVRRFAALALALLMAALLPMGAVAEGGITTPTDLQPAAEAPVEATTQPTAEPVESTSEVTEPEVTAEPTPVAVEETSEPAEEPSNPVCEEPTAEPTSEPVEEAPVETEQTVENTEVEPTAEPTAEPVDEIVTTDPATEEPTESREEITEEPAEEPVEEVIEEPAAPATVTIVLRTAGPLYYGDEVTLGVLVENVEGNYTITWQAKVAENRWEDVEVGMTYKFILTPENASMEYRAVLTVIE